MAFLAPVWLWLKVAWVWIKKNWMWLLFPIGAILFFAGRLTKSKPADVLAPELVGASEKSLQAREEADKAIAEASDDKTEQINKIELEHKETIEKLTDEQKKEAESLVEDPDKLNDFLLDVGKDIRK